MSRRPWIVVFAVVGLLGCGDDPSPLVGVWQVTTHTRNPTGCASEGAAVVDPPFLKFVAGSLLGQDYVERVDCTTATDCEDAGGLFGLFYAEPIDGGLRASVYVSSGDMTRCTLAAQRSDATVAGPALRIETRRFEGRDLVGVVCDPDTAEAMQATLPCAELEVITGTLVE
jgi:hypothetical protein